MDKYFKYPGSETRPPILSMLRNVSLVLADYHMSVGYAEPLLPNTIPVGGLSLKNGDKLPKVSSSILKKYYNLYPVYFQPTQTFFRVLIYELMGNFERIHIFYLILSS